MFLLSRSSLFNESEHVLWSKKEIPLRILLPLPVGWIKDTSSLCFLMRCRVAGVAKYLEDTSSTADESVLLLGSGLTAVETSSSEEESKIVGGSGFEPVVSISQRGLPTLQMESSWWRILTSLPVTVDEIGATSLSVNTSHRSSY